MALSEINWFINNFPASDAKDQQTFTQLKTELTPGDPNAVQIAEQNIAQEYQGRVKSG